MLFAFDGTCNKDNPGSKNDTNVVKVCESYAAGAVFYQPGVGTGGWLDKLFGGIGGYGGKSRIKKAMAELAKFPSGNVRIDVVGFSRGAALALDFCNEVNRVYGGSVIIRFVGLFDTVASFGVPGNNINLGYNFKLPHCVSHCMHAVSLDERRGMFPLTRVVQDTLTGTPASHIVHCLFRGFHSDVGGGNGNLGLSSIPLVWILDRMKKTGVPLTNIGGHRGLRSPAAQCKKPVDLVPNNKRAVDSRDYVHGSVSHREWACKGFAANNAPEGLRVLV